MFFIVLLLMMSLSGTFGFLANNLVGSEVRQGVVSRNCKELADMIYSERETRDQMRMYVQRLELELEKLVNSVSNMKENYKTLLFDHLDLKRKFDTNYVRSYTSDSDSIQKESGIIRIELKWIHHSIGLLFNKNDAHQQQFEALYNLTLLSQEKENELETDVRTKLQNHEKRTNDAVEELRRNMTAYTDGKILTLTLIQGAMAMDVNVLREEKSNKTDIVSLTACGGQVSEGRIIFPDIRTLYGIGNVDSLTVSGQFTCEKLGLYLFIFTIMAKSSNADYEIVKNGVKFAEVQVSPEYSNTTFNMYHSGTGSFVVLLDVNDTIGAMTSSITNLPNPNDDNSSCLTIVKLN